MQIKKKHSLFLNANINNNIGHITTQHKANLSQTNHLHQKSINDLSNIYKKNIFLTENEHKYENSKNNKTQKYFSLGKKLQKLQKIPKIKLSKNNIHHHHNNTIDKETDLIITRFKEYQRQMIPSLTLIRDKGFNISKHINSNPFMRKIENLNKINKFEILFHDAIMKNIISAQQKNKTGFFQGDCCGVNTNKDNMKGIYICENRANIYNVSEMIDRMNPSSVIKFSKLLRKDYKEFLGYNKKDYRNKKPKKEDKLRKKLIKKYHKELFYENEIADKYNIKKNSGIKFIQENDDENQKI
jgi:hypothetical protein